MKTRNPITLGCLLIGAVITACGPSPEEQAATATQGAANIFATLTAQAPSATPTPTPSPTATAAPTDTPTPRPTLTPRPSLTPTPGLSAIRLTLDDLPFGFEPLPADQMNELEEAYPEDSNVFGFQNRFSSQTVIGVLTLLETREDQAAFDAMLPQFVEMIATGVCGEKNFTHLRGLEHVGEARDGVSARSKAWNLSMRWEIIAFRRDEMSALIFISYPDSDKPAISYLEATRLLDERILNFLAHNPLPREKSQPNSNQEV